MVIRVEYDGDGSGTTGVAMYDAGDDGRASIRRLSLDGGPVGVVTALRLVITCTAIS